MFSLDMIVGNGNIDCDAIVACSCKSGSDNPW